MNYKLDLFWGFLLFALSALITKWFIDKGGDLYLSNQKMILSNGIAAAKWGIQIVAAFIFLSTKKYKFFRAIGLVCFIGSCILLPYCIFAFIRNIDKSFLFSLVFAVLAMVFFYYQAVKKLNLSLKWFWGWFICLSFAIFSQLFFVFKIISNV